MGAQRVLNPCANPQAPTGTHAVLGGVGASLSPPPSAATPIEAVVRASLRQLEALAAAASAMSDSERKARLWVERVFAKPAVFVLHNIVSAGEADRMLRRKP